MAHSLKEAIEEHKENHSSEIAPERIHADTFYAEEFESYCLVSDNEALLTKEDKAYLKANFDHFPEGFYGKGERVFKKVQQQDSQVLFPPSQRAVLTNGKIRELCHDEVDPMIYKYHEALEAAERELSELKAQSVRWSIDDFTMMAKKEGYILSRKKAKELLEGMIRHHDGELGINWQTLKCLITDNCKPTKKKKAELEERERKYERCRLDREAKRNEEKMRKVAIAFEMGEKEREEHKRLLVTP